MHYFDQFCSYTEEIIGNKHCYIFTGPCIITKKQYTVKVPANELYAYNQGALIQDALLSVSVLDREFLMSGISPEGFNIVFNKGKE